MTIRASGVLAVLSVFSLWACDQQRSAEVTSRDRIRSAQETSERALERAENAQERASREQREAARAEDRVAKAHEKVNEAEAKASKEAAEAQSAQLAAQREAQIAQEQAAQAQREATRLQAGSPTTATLPVAPSAADPTAGARAAKPDASAIPPGIGGAGNVDDGATGVPPVPPPAQ